MRRALAAMVASLASLGAGNTAAQEEPLALYAAGSLRGALTEIVQAFVQAGGRPVRADFGASGLLKDKLAAGHGAGLFASANMEHPQALAAAGRSEPAVPFARNALCLLAQPGFTLAGRGVAQRLLDAGVRVAMSTPRADPAGDYAHQMFERIESTGAAPAGSAAQLKAKAAQLTGGPQSPPPPADGRSLYGLLLAEDRADVFVVYCTAAAAARRERPQLQVLPVPEAINVSALYGATLLRPVSPAARDFLAFLQGPAGRAVLAAHGFSAP